jgi:hypothetical protein
MQTSQIKTDLLLIMLQPQQLAYLTALPSLFMEKMVAESLEAVLQFCYLTVQLSRLSVVASLWQWVVMQVTAQRVVAAADLLPTIIRMAIIKTNSARKLFILQVPAAQAETAVAVQVQVSVPMAVAVEVVVALEEVVGMTAE